MSQTLTTLAPILKEVYEGGVTPQLNDRAKAYQRIKSNSKAAQKWGGKYVNLTIHVARNSGIGSRNEQEPLPTAGYQDTREALVPMRYHYATVGITGQAIELANSDYQTFADSLNLEVTKIRTDVQKERNRQFFGTNLGTRATCTGAVSGQTVAVDSVKQLDMNGVYDIMVGVTNTVRQGPITITGINAATLVVTFTGTPTGITTNDIWVRRGLYGREWGGLGTIIDDTAVLHSLDPATVPIWKSELKTSAGSVSELMFVRMADRIYDNDGETTVIWSTLGVQRAWFSLLTSLKRFSNTTKFEGGFSGVAFQSASQGELPMIPDNDCPAGTAQFVNEKALTIYDNGNYKFMDRTGNMWRMRRESTGDYDEYYATLYQYSEIGTNRRNTHGKITGITEDSPS